MTDRPLTRRRRDKLPRGSDPELCQSPAGQRFLEPVAHREMNATAAVVAPRQGALRPRAAAAAAPVYFPVTIDGSPATTAETAVAAAALVVRPPLGFPNVGEKWGPPWRARRAFLLRRP